MKKILVKSDGTPGNTHINTEGGEELGMIQKCSWNLEVGGFARLTMESIMTPCDLEILQKNTEIIVTLPKEDKAREEAIFLLNKAIEALGDYIYGDSRGNSAYNFINDAIEKLV